MIVSPIETPAQDALLNKTQYNCCFDIKLLRLKGRQNAWLLPQADANRIFFIAHQFVNTDQTVISRIAKAPVESC